MTRMTLTLLLLCITCTAAAQNTGHPGDAPGAADAKDSQAPAVAPVQPGPGGTQGQTPQETVIPDENQIADKTRQFIAAVIGQDQQGVMNLLVPDGPVEVAPEISMTRDQVLNDFNNRGRVWNSLFDSKRYHEQNVEYLKQFSTVDVGDFSLCLRDIFLAVRDRRIRIREMMVYEPGVVAVVLNWDGKDDAASPSRRVNYVLTFVYKNNNWYLTSLDIRREIFR